MRRQDALPMAVLALLAGCAGGGAPVFTPEDAEAVRQLEEGYRRAWERNDSAAVMATLAPGAVLMPAGMEPLQGESAVRNYWWPNDGSTTVIDSYELTVDEVDGAGDVAYVRGRGSLSFRYRDPAGIETAFASQSVHLSVARRGPDGVWRIARRAWSALQ